MGNKFDNEATEYRSDVNENTILHGTNATGNQTPGKTTPAQPSAPSASAGAVPPPYIPKNQINPQAQPNFQAQPAQKSKGNNGKSAVVGGIGGAILGGGLSAYAAQHNWGGGDDDGDIIDATSDGDTHRDTLTNPDWVDHDIQVATSVDDNMTFGQAFAAARAEIGPGGCFEWYGNVYSTYIAEEWEQMTPEQQAEFNDHFSWNHHSSNNTAHTDHTADTPVEPADTITAEVPSQGSIADTGGYTDDMEPGYDIDTAEPEIEILGVEHVYDLDANVGSLVVDNQEVLLIDVDGDMEFDYMTMDMNGDGQIDDSEYVDIQGTGINVDDLGGFNDPGIGFVDPDDNIDYSDGVYEA